MNRIPSISVIHSSKVKTKYPSKEVSFVRSKFDFAVKRLRDLPTSYSDCCFVFLQPEPARAVSRLQQGSKSKQQLILQKSKFLAKIDMRLLLIKNTIAIYKSEQYCMDMGK